MNRVGLRIWSLLLLLAAGGSVLAEEIIIPSRPAISPDAKTIAFSYLGDIWSVPVAGGEAIRLTHHSATDSEPHFSPDGKQLAFTSNRTGNTQVFLMPVDGGVPKQVTFHTAGYSIEGWLPDGRRMLVSSSRDHYWRNAERFFIVDLEKRSADQMLFDAYGSDASLSPDGNQLLFVREGERWWRKGYRGARSAQIWMYDLTTQAFTKVVDKETDCRWPMWKPDGKGFYYTCGETTDGYNLWDYTIANKADTQLTRFPQDSVVFPSLSKDGSTIIFRHLFHLYTFDTATKKLPTRLTINDESDGGIDPMWRRTLTSATNVTFTSDGLEIAFVAGGDVWVMDTELREPVQITNTAEEIREVNFSVDGNTLFYLGDKDGQADLFKVERADTKRFWWQNEKFVTAQLTDSADVESDLQISPDTKHLFFVKGRGDLWMMGVDGTVPKQLLTGFRAPNYSISPDGKWVVYDQEDDDFNNDIWIAPVDGSREPYNVSRHPDDDYSPVWSPDGKMIAFTGRRADGETDIHYVWLNRKDDESSRARKIQKALDKFKKLRKAPTPPTTPPAKPGTTPAKPGTTPAKPATPAAATGPKLPEITIEFEDLYKRVKRISIPNSTERGLFFSYDSKRLAFSGSVKGANGTYTVTFPDSLSPKLLNSSTGSFANWLPKTKSIVWLVNGVPSSLAANGAAARYSFRVNQELDIRQRHQAAFDQCWRVMRDNWYDEKLGNRNWDEVRRKYRDAAGKVTDIPRLSTIVHLMLGELNGSHLGFSAGGARRNPNAQQWSIETAHLGVRFDPAHNGPGLKIRDVIPGSPASKTGSKLEAGEIILTIDGVTVDPAYDLTQVLNGPLSRDIKLKVQGTDEKKTERDVIIRPFSYAAARSLLYPMVVDQRETLVEKLSAANLGYLHIRSMNMSSFVQFEKELYEIGYGKDGLVIDVRDNGGGFTTDHLLTVLTQPRHAITLPRGGGRGYPQDRMIYATWHKPIIVLCNQNSYSNAEIFSHAIKGLKRGKLVGVPTAGGVISTGGVGIMDLGFLRLPFRGWFVQSTGEDMELHGAVPDVIIWPMPGELPGGNDKQLEEAVKLLTKDVAAWKARQPVKLKYATQR